MMHKEEYENEQDNLRIPVKLMASGSSALLYLSIQRTFLQAPFHKGQSSLLLSSLNVINIRKC